MQVDSVSAWMAGMSRYPLLSAAQEISLSKTVQRGLAEGASPREKKAGQRAKEKFICSNLRLIVAVAQKFRQRIASSSALSLEDLLQAGAVGLSKAVDKFDPEAGYKFSTYAYWWCRQSIMYTVKTTSAPIRIPSDLYDVGTKLRFKPKDQSLEDFAAENNYTMHRVQRAMEASATANVKSLDERTMGAESEHSSLLDLIADPRSPELEDLDYQLAVEQLERLSDPDDYALVGLHVDGAKATEISELLGVNITASKHRLSKAKDRLRSNVKEFEECLK